LIHRLVQHEQAASLHHGDLAGQPLVRAVSRPPPAPRTGEGGSRPETSARRPASWASPGPRTRHPAPPSGAGPAGRCRPRTPCPGRRELGFDRSTSRSTIIPVSLHPSIEPDFFPPPENWNRSTHPQATRKTARSGAAEYARHESAPAFLTVQPRQA
jgi:hypothetical protein